MSVSIGLLVFICTLETSVGRTTSVEIDDEELHLLLSAYYQAISEIVYHDFDREKTRYYIEILKKFFYSGW